jgi:hypothetical protein
MNELQTHEFEVFRAGDYGDQGIFTEDDLDTMASSYDPIAVHNAPVVLGHPKADSPAHGWGESFRRAGKVLLCKAKLLPEMVDWIKRGLYTQRSLAIYRDAGSPGGGKPYVKHIGFLGGTPPAVKGLAPITLGEHEGDFVEVEFTENQNYKEKHMAQELMFSEAQVADKVTAELLKKETALRLEFSEALTKKDAEISTLRAKADDLEAKVSEFSEKGLKAEVDNFVDGLCKEGKMVPASKDKVAATLIELAKVSPKLFAEQKDIYASNPKLVEFGERKAAEGDEGGEHIPSSYSIATGETR